MENSEFEACIRRIQQGDKSGLKEIYQAYVAMIYSVAYSILGQKEDAQDVASEFFIRLWDKADSYRFGGAHKGWMLTIARNMCMDFLRKHKRELPVDEFPEEECPGRDFAEESVGRLAMEEAIQRLKPAEQEVLDLKIVAELTFQEIADVLNKPMGTVTWLYRQGIEKLRKYHGKEVQ